MALAPESLALPSMVSRLYADARGWVQGLFGTAEFSPEETLASGTIADARLLPRVPMSSDEIDVSVLNMLGQHGLKRGKQVTAQSHPELFAAWEMMAKRAGLQQAPQLIIAESNSLNALTISPQEVAITTGLLKVLSLPEVVAVLGHELGHAGSNHTGPRVAAMSLFGGVGALAGNEFAHRGGFGKWMDHAVENPSRLRKFMSDLVGKGDKPFSFLASALTVVMGASAGGIIANQVSVKPTELDADRKGAVISGDPLALAAALRKLDENRSKQPVQNAWSYLRSGYPTMEHRISNLERMAASTAHDPVLAHVLAATPVASHAVPAAPTHRVHHMAGVERLGTPVSGPHIAV